MMIEVEREAITENKFREVYGYEPPIKEPLCMGIKRLANIKNRFFLENLVSLNYYLTKTNILI